MFNCQAEQPALGSFVKYLFLQLIINHNILNLKGCSITFLITTNKINKKHFPLNQFEEKGLKKYLIYGKTVKS